LKNIGVMGDPFAASLEKGKAVFNIAVTKLQKIIDDNLNCARVLLQFCLAVCNDVHCDYNLQLKFTTILRAGSEVYLGCNTQD